MKRWGKRRSELESRHSATVAWRTQDLIRDQQRISIKHIDILCRWGFWRETRLLWNLKSRIYPWLYIGRKRINYRIMIELCLSFGVTSMLIRSAFMKIENAYLKIHCESWFAFCWEHNKLWSFENICESVLRTPIHIFVNHSITRRHQISRKVCRFKRIRNSAFWTLRKLISQKGKFFKDKPTSTIRPSYCM